MVLVSDRPASAAVMSTCTDAHHDPSTGQDCLTPRCPPTTMSFPKCQQDFSVASGDTSLSSVCVACTCDSDPQVSSCASSSSSQESLNVATSVVSKNISANKNEDYASRYLVGECACCRGTHSGVLEESNFRAYKEPSHRRRPGSAGQCCRGSLSVPARPLCSLGCSCEMRRAVSHETFDQLQINPAMDSPHSPIIDNLILEPRNVIRFDPATKAKIRKQVAKCLKEEILRARAYVEKEATRMRRYFDRTQERTSSTPTNVPTVASRTRPANNGKIRVNTDSEFYLAKLDDSIRKNCLGDDKRRKQPLEKRAKDAETVPHPAAADRARKKSPTKRQNVMSYKMPVTKQTGGFGDMMENSKQKRLLKIAPVKPDLRKADACPKKQENPQCARKVDCSACSRRQDKMSKPQAKARAAAPRPCPHQARSKGSEEAEATVCKEAPLQTVATGQMNDSNMERSLFTRACNRKMSSSAPECCLATSTHQPFKPAATLPQKHEFSHGISGLNNDHKRQSHRQLDFLERLPDDITADEIRELVKVVVTIIERRLAAATETGRKPDQSRGDAADKHDRNLNPCQHHTSTHADPKIYYSTQSADALGCATFVKSSRSDTSRSKTEPAVSLDRKICPSSRLENASTCTSLTKEPGDLLDFLSELAAPHAQDNNKKCVSVDPVQVFSDNTSDSTGSPFSAYTLPSSQISSGTFGSTIMKHKSRSSRKSTTVQPYDNFTLHNRPTVMPAWERERASTDQAIHQKEVSLTSHNMADKTGLSESMSACEAGGKSWARATAFPLHDTKENESSPSTGEPSTKSKARSLSNIDTLLFSQPHPKPADFDKARGQLDGSALECKRIDDQCPQGDGSQIANTSLVPAGSLVEEKCDVTLHEAALSSSLHVNLPEETFQKRLCNNDTISHSSCPALHQSDRKEEKVQMTEAAGLSETFPSQSSTRSDAGSTGKGQCELYDLDALSWSADTVLTDTSLTKRLLEIDNELVQRTIKDWKCSATKQYILDLQQIRNPLDLSGQDEDNLRNTYLTARPDNWTRTGTANAEPIFYETKLVSQDEPNPQTQVGTASSNPGCMDSKGPSPKEVKNEQKSSSPQKSSSTSGKSEQPLEERVALDLTDSLNELRENTNSLLAEVYRKYYPDKYTQSLIKIDLPDLGKALDFLENFSPICPADVNTEYPLLTASQRPAAPREGMKPKSGNGQQTRHKTSETTVPAAMSHCKSLRQGTLEWPNSFRAGDGDTGTASTAYVCPDCIAVMEGSRGKNDLKQRASDISQKNIILDVTSQHHIHDPLLVRIYDSKSAIPVNVKRLQSKYSSKTLLLKANTSLARDQHTVYTSTPSKGSQRSVLSSAGREKCQKKSPDSWTASISRSYTVLTAPTDSNDVQTDTSTPQAGKTSDKLYYSITNKSLASETEESDMTSSSQLNDTSEWNYSENNNSHSQPKNKCSSNKPRPSTKILGELAFQLERRILDYVFGLDGCKRRRFYGYTVSNICVMMKKEAQQPSGQQDPFIKTDMANRLRKILLALKKKGYDIKVHGDFAQEMVNKYGLLACPPDASTIEEFGLQDPECIASLITQLATGPHEISNLTILLESLKYLSKCDGRPLFVW